MPRRQTDIRAGLGLISFKGFYCLDGGGIFAELPGFAAGAELLARLLKLLAGEIN